MHKAKKGIKGHIKHFVALLEEKMGGEEHE